MAIHKLKLKGKGVSWCYLFSAPGATRDNRRQIKKAGFATKKEGIDAEAARRLEIASEAEATPGAAPRTLGAVIREWLAERGPALSPKTASRYAELAEYLSNPVKRSGLTYSRVPMPHAAISAKSLSQGSRPGRRPRTPKLNGVPMSKGITNLRNRARYWSWLNFPRRSQCYWENFSAAR